MADLAYPAQPCGLPYRDFKSGWLYKDAYEHVAYGRGEGPRTITQRTVLRQMSRLKKDEYQRYKDDCAIGSREEPEGEDEGAYAEEGDTSFDFNGVRGVQKKLPFMRKSKYGHRRARQLPWPYRPPQRASAKKPQSSKGKRCTIAGALRTCITDDGHINFTYTPAGHREPVGQLDVFGAQHIGGRCALEVGGVEVDVAYVDKGIGTRLYEAAAREASRHGCTLISDSQRSVFSEAFWRKQKRKGRAVCSAMGSGGSYYAKPLEALKSRCEHGYVSKATCDKLLDASRLPEPDGGAWPCRRWILNFPPPDSLAGVRRKKGRR